MSQKAIEEPNLTFDETLFRFGQGKPIRAIDFRKFLLPAGLGRPFH